MIELEATKLVIAKVEDGSVTGEIEVKFDRSYSFTPDETLRIKFILNLAKA